MTQPTIVSTRSQPQTIVSQRFRNGWLITHRAGTNITYIDRRAVR